MATTFATPYSLLPTQLMPLTLDRVPDDQVILASTVCQRIAADPLTHTMGSKLMRYVIPKIHTAIQTNTFASILVIGAHTRSPTDIITGNEKADKPFNWQRPTARVVYAPEGNILQLSVIPGHAYVEHYAALIATYVASKAFAGTRIPTVHYRLPPADASVTLFANSNLRHLGPVDIAIVGYVDSLPNSTGTGDWETATATHSGAGEPPLFAWKKRKLQNGRIVAFVGCTACYWGDIGGQLIRSLSELSGVREAIYIGKLGTLDERHVPNSVLATGSCSKFHDGGMVEWESVLDRAVQGSRIVVNGVHCTVATSLCETKEWARDWKTKADWVDPEIGHMARVSIERGVLFGYLHVVSDNLSREGLEGLVDERKATIIADRKKLLQEVEWVLERYFSEIGER
ncbi:hypothetical protein LARI1_G002593 [Lachnellula arida]|uniref:Nucleoside phosphorylase domain-containing protein n=1 Tax=Lachnellula arida TaxID=1316785 RepID=A0A8T9BH52_9HELO|nr:hypothetical protein LARI1_G002593 [Lachnellula arida]